MCLIVEIIIAVVFPVISFFKVKIVGLFSSFTNEEFCSLNIFLFACYTVKLYKCKLCYLVTAIASFTVFVKDVAYQVCEFAGCFL